MIRTLSLLASLPRRAAAPLALAGAALVAALAGAFVLLVALLVLAPLVGLLLLALDLAWVIGLPLSWWLTRGRCKPSTARNWHRAHRAQRG